MASSDLTFRIFGKDISATRALKGVATQSNTTGKSLGGLAKNFGGVAAIATAAAAGVAAMGIGLFDAAKAAVEDEKSAKVLATTLKNVTKATDAQVASVEDYIDQKQRAKGVTDDELRPALSSLVRVTGDVTKAQGLMSTALDIAAGTGKPVEVIALALSKAYAGNTGALAKLGLNMKDANGKALPFADALARINGQFGGQAEAAANTYDGKMKRLNITFDELKESLGYKVLPLLTKFADWLMKDGIPALERFWTKVDKDIIPALQTYLSPAINAVRDAFKSMGQTVKDNQQFFNDLGTIMRPLALFAGGQMVLSIRALAIGFQYATVAASMSLAQFKALGNGVVWVVDRARDLVAYFRLLPAMLTNATAGMWDGLKSSFRYAMNWVIGKWNGLTFKTPDFPGSDFGGQTIRMPRVTPFAAGGVITKPTLALMGEAGTETVLPYDIRKGGGMGATVNITVNGAVDKDGTARQIRDLLLDLRRSNGALGLG